MADQQSGDFRLQQQRPSKELENRFQGSPVPEKYQNRFDKSDVHPDDQPLDLQRTSYNPSQLPAGRTTVFTGNSYNPGDPDIFITAPQHNVRNITLTRATPTTSSIERLHPLTPVYPYPRTNPATLRSPSIPQRQLSLATASAMSPSSSDHGSPSRSGTPTPAAARIKGRGQIRSSSLPGDQRFGKHSIHRSGTPHPHGKPSVKHLTCYWWKEKGDCRFREADCLYSHYDTGLYADAPRQVLPGESALAGRSLERALKKLQTEHNVSAKPSTTFAMAPPLVKSGPPTPADASKECSISPQDFAFMRADGDSKPLQSENTFLRTLVEQSTKEKAVLVTTIENLQSENKNLKQLSEGMISQAEQLKQERDVLRDVVNRLQHNQESQQAQTSNANNHNHNNAGMRFGVIRGPPAAISSAEAAAAELQSQNASLRDMLRNYGHSV